MTQVAHLLKVHRQTIYYWIKKNWVKLRRGYRNYPVFTVSDIENLMKRRNTIKSE
ncbi:MAG: MerR family transcriptional regulator [Candidatus Omnitrophica bacterium]|nr:MerR family transcriptional regulator [Candidatus Omnitrophota bacterium]